jgi:glucokinase
MAGGRRCFCGNRGCFEAYASGSAFADRAIERAAVHESTSLGRNGASITAPAVFDAADAGDALALELVAEQARMLGQGFASLLHLYSPDMLIMGGGLSGRFDVLAPGILESLTASAMPAFRDTPVVKAALGSDSGLLGAASLVFPAS